MRAARLLHMLLLLQNRGQMTSAMLAQELEVSRRTILRDVDAMTEAGLPIVVTHGPRGGIALGFDYRTRLTGLESAEAEAMGVLLSLDLPELADLGLAEAAARARAKIWEAFPDQTRAQMAEARRRFAHSAPAAPAPDEARAAMAQAVRARRIVRLQATSAAPVVVHPVGLRLGHAGWWLVDGISGRDIAEADWGDINISARSFDAGDGTKIS